MLIAVLTAALALHASSAAPATPAASPEPPKAQVAQVADKDRMVCKTEALAGSRVPKRVCATKGEWEARRAEDKEHLDAMQRASKPHISQ
ncbi:MULTISPECIES: hypothetical protein [Phenylobacterium]|uniref:Secreted protein n=1 Tax=Phenylobacterium koreense TaxID=266125 RepID=A0ABV2EIK2_9CAUL